MNLDTLKRKYAERAAEERKIGALAPVDRILESVIDDLEKVDGQPTRLGFATTDEASELLPLKRNTIARKCAAGDFSGAKKTAEGGVWLIPWKAIYAYLDDDPDVDEQRLRIVGER